MLLRQRPPGHAAFAWAAAAAAAVFIISSPRPLRAQSSQAAREAARIDMLTRERALRELEKLKRARAPEKSLQNRAAYSQLAEEFKQLQLRNYDLAGVVLTGPELDYGLIRRESAEVRKRAERLKAYLLLPEPEGEGVEVGEVRTIEELKSAISRLDALVNSFVWNPSFQQPGVVDAEHSLKARRELEAILKLSVRIKKCAEALSKAAAKP
jgi:hypothetical protein